MDSAENSEDVILTHQQQFLVTHLESLTGVTGENDTVAGLDLQRMPVALIVEFALANADNHTTSRLVRGRIGKQNASGSLLGTFLSLHHNAVTEGNQG